jgi:hypothetical protein
VCNLSLGRNFGEIYCMVALLKKNTGAKLHRDNLAEFYLFCP